MVTDSSPTLPSVVGCLEDTHQVSPAASHADPSWSGRARSVPSPAATRLDRSCTPKAVPVAGRMR